MWKILRLGAVIALVVVGSSSGAFASASEKIVSNAAVAAPMPRQTLSEVSRAIAATPLVLLACPTGCSFDPTTGVASGYVPVSVRVVSVRVRGLGQSRSVGGEAAFTAFEVHVCAIDYLAGAKRVSAHIRWHSTSGLQTRSHTPGTPGQLPKTPELQRLWNRLKQLIATGAPQAQVQQAAAAYKAAGQRLGTKKVWGPAFAEDWNAHGLAPLLREGC